MTRVTANRESQAPYVGPVAAHFTDCTLKTVLRAPITDGPHETPVFIDEGRPFLSVDAIQNGELQLDGCRYISESNFQEYRRKAAPARGDLLMGKAASTGKIARVKTDTEFAIWSPLALLRLNSESVDSRFVEYVLKTPALQQQIDDLCNSNTQKNIGMGDIPRLAFARPPLSEQECIANFLDDKTTRIDALIAEKELLSSTLVAMKRDAIDAAVLGGYTARCGQTLNGLEVLGPIPQDWTSSRMKFELEYVTSGSRGWAEHYADDGALFVRIGNLTRDSIELDLSDIQRVALPEAAEGVRARVHPGDLLISITAYLGSVAVAPVGIEEAYVSQHVSLARPNCLRALPKWLGYVVLSSIGRTFFDLQAYGGTKVQLSLDDIRELPVPLPPTEVQSERIRLLEARLCSLTELATHVQEHISRLREYRSSLISAAVTGQLDVGSFEASKA